MVDQMTNIEIFKQKQLNKIERKIFSVIRRKKYVLSIKALNNMIEDKSYGSVYNAVNKLHEKGKIIVEKYYDKTNGVDKKGIFLNEEEKEKFMEMQNVANEMDVLSQYTPVKLSQLVVKTNLQKLFEIIMTEDPNNVESEYTNDIKRIININNSEVNIYDIRNIILDIIVQIMELDLDDIYNLYESNEDMDVLIKNEQ